jgi:ribosome-binding factor A
MIHFQTTKPKRTVQVGGLIQREISEILLRKIKDPRLELVTITAIEVSPDLKVAKVYFSHFGGSEEIKRSLEGLQSASGFIKRELGQRMKLRQVPDLTFIHDTSFEYGDHIDSVLKDLFTDKEKDPSES